MKSSVFVEAFAVGIIVILVGVLLHYVLLKTYGHHDLNNIKVYIGHLFLIGVITHLLCEFSGINRWYCKYGTACK